MKYIDANLLRKEIERRRLHFNKEAEKYQALNNGYSQNCYGARDALRDLENYLDTLSEEPFKSLEEAAEDADCMVFGGDPAYYGNKAEFSVNECIRLFTAGAEWGAEHFRDSTKMIDKGLEEAADDYIGKVVDDGWEWETHDIVEAFIAGAEWQKEQDNKLVDIIYQQGIEKGKDYMKEQILKDAVEATVMATKCGDKYQQLLISDWNYMSDMCNGQKVRIVVLKAEEE